MDLPGRAEFGAQAAHVGVDGAAAGAPLVVPDPCYQLLAGEHGPGRGGERVEQVELLGDDVDHLAVHPDLARPGVEVPRGDRDAVRGRLRALEAAHHGLDPSRRPEMDQATDNYR
jgi:hypothetical protein